MLSLGPLWKSEGPWYRRSRVMPVEGRSPGSGALLREVETGHCRKARTQFVKYLRKKLYGRAKRETQGSDREGPDSARRPVHALL